MKIMTPSLGQHLNQMKHGDEIQVPPNHSVRYESEQAMGDDNRPAKGYTVGYFHVTGPSGTKSFRHSPQGPGLMGAKGYAADQAAGHIASAFNDRRPRT